MTDVPQIAPFQTDGTVVQYCQTMPGALLAQGKFEQARAFLAVLAKCAQEGALPNHFSEIDLASKPAHHPAPVGSPSALASLWFIQAAYVYYSCQNEPAFWRQTLLPAMKRLGLSIVGGEFPNLRMDDGGLLESTDTIARPLIVNILWDNALSILDEELKAAGDPGCKHFEHLRGRFKRSFLKMFWLDDRNFLLPPAKLIYAVPPATDAAAPPPSPVSDPAPPSASPSSEADPAQLLMTVLAFSAVPRTKQRLVVDWLKTRRLGIYGLQVDSAASGPACYSPLLLAWLAEGHVRTSDMPATTIAEAKTLLQNCYELLSRTGTLSEFYDAQGQPVGAAPYIPHGPSAAEVYRVWHGLLQVAERPLGNSKRSRITGGLMPTAVNRDPGDRVV